MDAWSGSDLVVYRQRTSASTSSLPLGHDAPASDARRRIDGAAIRTRRTLPTHRHGALVGDPARPASGRLPGTVFTSSVPRAMDSSGTAGYIGSHSGHGTCSRGPTPGEGRCDGERGARRSPGVRAGQSPPDAARRVARHGLAPGPEEPPV